MSGRLLHAGSARTHTPPTPVRWLNFTSHPTGPQEPIMILQCLPAIPPLSWARINNATGWNLLHSVGEQDMGFHPLE
jgi:hypothetical protein